MYMCIHIYTYTTHKKLRTIWNHTHISQTIKVKFKFGIHFIQCFRNHCAKFHLHRQNEYWCTVHQTEYVWICQFTKSLHFKNRTLKVSFQHNNAGIHHCLRDTHCSDSSWTWRGLWNTVGAVPATLPAAIGTGVGCLWEVYGCFSPGDPAHLKLVQ